MSAGRRCPLCGDMDYSDLGDMPCYCRRQAEVSLYPTDTDLCRGAGHMYYGDDADCEDGRLHKDDERCECGRCYCGERRYHRGGVEPLVVFS